MPSFSTLLWFSVLTAFNLSGTHSEADCINSLKQEMLNIQKLLYDVNAKSSVSITFTLDFITDRLNFKLYLSLLKLFLQKFWELTICFTCMGKTMHYS